MRPLTSIGVVPAESGTAYLNADSIFKGIKLQCFGVSANTMQNIFSDAIDTLRLAIGSWMVRGGHVQFYVKLSDNQC